MAARKATIIAIGIIFLLCICQLLYIFKPSLMKFEWTLLQPPTEFEDDWFDENKWLPSEYCPYYENICFYNQHLKVHTREDEFSLNCPGTPNPQKLFGGYPNIGAVKGWESWPIYHSIINATIWNKGEYNASKCKFNHITNHMIIESHYQTMLGEWFQRTLRGLYVIFNVDTHLFTLNENVKLYLFIGDQMPLYTSHHLFLQPFTKYYLSHFTDLVERIDCNCYKRLFFCGFAKHHNKTTKKTFLRPQKNVVSWYNNSHELSNTVYAEMISFYNDWINDNDINIIQDTKQWKMDMLYKHNITNVNYKHINKWSFVGFSQRTSRRKWLDLQEVLIEKCNMEYNKYNIFCTMIILEGNLHPRDVVIMHRALDVLIGIHGSQLPDAIWMYNPTEIYNKEKYLIELLPYNAPSWTSSVKETTIISTYFWNSFINSVGLKLWYESLTLSAQRKRKWDDDNFYVNWVKLKDILNFILIDNGGYCSKFNQKPSDIKLPNDFKEKNYTFTIYNAVCNGSIWHFARNKNFRGFCQNCSTLQYENNMNVEFIDQF